MIKLEQIFASFRSIYCECRECSGVFRLSDAAISFGNQASSNDWLENIDKKIEALEEKIEREEEKFLIKRNQIKELARAEVEKTTNIKVKRLVPNFSKIELNMLDVKTIGFPVSFISFDGKSEGRTERVRLIDFEPKTKKQELRLQDISNVIKNGNIDWKTFIIDDSGRVGQQLYRKS